MKIRVWGSRGSIPSPGPSTVRCGGNTSCVEVCLNDGTLIILDAGTGIRPLGMALGCCEATLLLTHYHWDHIQGLPFFAPAFSAKSNIRVIGPEFNGEGPREYLDGQMMTPYFPAPPSQLRAMRQFQIAPTEPIAVGSAVVCARRVCHPSVTLGYRIQDEDTTLTYISDNEVDLASAGTFDDIVALAAGADILIHDCQYNEAEYAVRRGWGHSTPRQAARVANEAGVKRLMLFHHDPSHSDEQVEALAAEVASMTSGATEVIIGREGETVALDRELATSLSAPRHRRPTVRGFSGRSGQRFTNLGRSPAPRH